MYYVRVKIGDSRYESEANPTATIKGLYDAGRRIARWGRYHHVKTRFIVNDLETGKSVFRMYSRESEKRGWISRRVGVYDDI